MKVKHLPVLLSNGDTAGELLNFNFLKAFGLEETRRTLWTPKTTTKKLTVLTMWSFFKIKNSVLLQGCSVLDVLKRKTLRNSPLKLSKVLAKIMEKLVCTASRNCTGKLNAFSFRYFWESCLHDYMGKKTLRK